MSQTSCNKTFIESQIFLVLFFESVAIITKLSNLVLFPELQLRPRLLCVYCLCSYLNFSTSTEIRAQHGACIIIYISATSQHCYSGRVAESDGNLEALFAEPINTFNTFQTYKLSYVLPLHVQSNRNLSCSGCELMGTSLLSRKD